MTDSILIILGTICLFAGYIFSIKPVIPGVLVSYIGLWMFKWSHFFYIPQSTLTFWGIATLIILGIDFLSQKDKSRSLTGPIYIGIGSLAGMILGMLFDYSMIIVGAFIGSVLGEFAFSISLLGKNLTFPSSVFIHYFCAKGLRIIIATSMLGVIHEMFISEIHYIG